MKKPTGELEKNVPSHVHKIIVTDIGSTDIGSTVGKKNFINHSPETSPFSYVLGGMLNISSHGWFMPLFYITVPMHGFSISLW